MSEAQYGNPDMPALTPAVMAARSPLLVAKSEVWSPAQMAESFWEPCQAARASSMPGRSACIA